MSPLDKKPGKFYELFKVHKEHVPPNLPPGRPVISGCGSFTENVSKYVDHHAKGMVPEIESYIQDTPDLLRQFEEMKDHIFSPETFPVSIDVVGLYPNIPHKEGLKALGEALEKRQDKTIPSTFLVEMMQFVLETNIFEFDKKLWLQLIGTAIGTGAAPTLANLFMAVIDKLVEECGVFNKQLIKLLKRFIDDILLFWSGTVTEFEEFMKKINNLHPTIKFTCEYNFERRSTTFLDMEIRLVNGKIQTNLYRKKTDKIQYLLPSSCHPTHIFDNIPYSLALRVIRICSQDNERDERLIELEAMLKSRNYNANVVKAAINKAKEVGRSKALEKVEKKKNKHRVTLAVKYHPGLPSMSKILQTHWRTMTKEKKLLEIFPEPPMVAYQQHANLRSMLVKAR